MLPLAVAVLDHLSWSILSIISATLESTYTTCDYIYLICKDFFCHRSSCAPFGLCQSGSPQRMVICTVLCVGCTFRCNCNPIAAQMLKIRFEPGSLAYNASHLYASYTTRPRSTLLDVLFMCHYKFPFRLIHKDSTNLCFLHFSMNPYPDFVLLFITIVGQDRILKFCDNIFRKSCRVVKSLI